MSSKEKKLIIDWIYRQQITEPSLRIGAVALFISDKLMFWKQDDEDSGVHRQTDVTMHMILVIWP